MDDYSVCYDCHGSGEEACFCGGDEECQLCGGRDKVACHACGGTGLGD